MENFNSYKNVLILFLMEYALWVSVEITAEEIIKLS